MKLKDLLSRRESLPLSPSVCGQLTAPVAGAPTPPASAGAVTLCSPLGMDAQLATALQPRFSVLCPRMPGFHLLTSAGVCLIPVL